MIGVVVRTWQVGHMTRGSLVNKLGSSEFHGHDREIFKEIVLNFFVPLLYFISNSMKMRGRRKLS